MGRRIEASGWPCRAARSGPPSVAHETQPEKCVVKFATAAARVRCPNFKAMKEIFFPDVALVSAGTNCFFIQKLIRSTIFYLGSEPVFNSGSEQRVAPSSRQNWRLKQSMMCSLKPKIRPVALSALSRKPNDQ